MDIAALFTAALNAPSGAPRRSTLRVGRDLLALTIADARPAKRETLIKIADTAAISSEARAMHQSRRLGQTDQDYSFAGYTIRVKGKTGGAATEEGAAGAAVEIYRNGTLLGTHTITEDSRLFLDGEGKPQFVAAKSGGALRAVGDKDILFRVSATTVDNGDFSTAVVNLGSSAVTVTGGKGGNSYFGNYANSEIIGGQGKNTFFGAFDNSRITGGDAGNTFDGSYLGTNVQGGAGVDSFTGVFLDKSALAGNAGNDIFSGYFFSSALDGGDGDDAFGNRLTAGKRMRNPFSGGLEARGNDDLDITVSMLGSSIIGGNGDDTVQGAYSGTSIALGEGDNTAEGVFLSSSLTFGDGNNTFKGFYVKDSSIATGAGDDDIRIATSFNTGIITGEGTNTVSLGARADDTSWRMATAGGGLLDMRDTFVAVNYDPIHNAEKHLFGTLKTNTVEAASGDTTVTVTVDGITRNYRNEASPSTGAAAQPGVENASATKPETANASAADPPGTQDSGGERTAGPAASEAATARAAARTAVQAAYSPSKELMAALSKYAAEQQKGESPLTAEQTAQANERKMGEALRALGKGTSFAASGGFDGAARVLLRDDRIATVDAGRKDEPQHTWADATTHANPHLRAAIRAYTGVR